MAASGRNGIDGLGAQLVGELAQLFGREITQLGRNTDPIEQRSRGPGAGAGRQYGDVHRHTLAMPLALAPTAGMRMSRSTMAGIGYSSNPRSGTLVQSDALCQTMLRGSNRDGESVPDEHGLLNTGPRGL